jgi:hypothetical protein
VTEPDVTLTDYGLFAECAAFAWLIARQPTKLATLRRWIVLFFLSTALAALLGGTVHGFFSEETGTIGRLLWKVSMLAIGATALAVWAIGTHLMFPRRGADRMVAIAAVLTAIYAAVIVFVSDAFWVAVAGYLPAAVFLLAGFLRAALRERLWWARRGASHPAASRCAPPRVLQPQRALSRRPGGRAGAPVHGLPRPAGIDKRSAC